MHIFKNIISALREAGVPQKKIDTMLMTILGGSSASKRRHCYHALLRKMIVLYRLQNSYGNQAFPQTIGLALITVLHAVF